MVTRSKSSGSALAGEKGTPEIVVEDVFLSPRVVDRRTFAELSGELRQLVEKAAGERGFLGSALEQAAAAVRAIQGSESAQQGNLELTAKAIKKIDERIAKAQSLLDRAGDITASTQAFSIQADALIETKMNAIEARLEAVQSAAAARVEALEERLRAATRELEQRIEAIRRDVEAVAAPSLVALNKACADAKEIMGLDGREGTLGGLVAQAEVAGVKAQQAMREFDDLQARSRVSQGALNAVLEGLAKVTNDVEAKHASIQQDADKLCQAGQSAAAALERRIEESRRLGEQVLSEIKPRVDALSAGFTQTTQQAALVAGQVDEASAKLGDVIKQANDTHNTTALTLRLVDKSLAQVHELLRTLDPWRRLVLQQDDAELPAPVRAVIDGIKRELRGDLGAIAQALRAAAETAERSVGSVDSGAIVASTPGAGASVSTPIVLGASPSRERSQLSSAAD